MSKQGLLTPLILAVALALSLTLLRMLEPAWIDPRVHIYILAAVSAAASVVLVRAINFFLFDIIFRRRKGRPAPQLLRVLVATICYSAIFVFVYTVVFGKDLSAMLATSAVLSVILGLALQDTLVNFFAGVSLHIEQPFHIGDTLRMSDMVGSVESVTWRTTTIRTSDNSLVIVPNSKIARDPVEIYPLNSLNRRALRFQAPYAVPPRKIIAVVRQSVHSLPRLAPEREPVIRIAEFSDSAITYELLYWVSDYMWVPDMDSIIRERIWYSFGRNGIEIPFPVRHVLLEKRATPAGGEETDCQNLLAAVEILKPLASQELQELARSLVRRTYAPGELVVSRGEAGDSMFIISRGRVEVLVPDANGQNQQVALLAAGNFFGEMSLFTGENRAADVRALEELELLVIQKPAIERLLNENDRLALAFSAIIAERHARLAEISRTVPEEEKKMQRESIFQRIQRFFSLG